MVVFMADTPQQTAAHTGAVTKHGAPTTKVLLRVGGMPIERVEELHFTESVAQAEKVLQLEAEIARLKEQLLDILQASFSQHRENAQARSLILKLKRDVFNARWPKNAAELAAVAPFLTTAGEAVLHRWSDRGQHRQESLQQYYETFAAELVQKRRQLKALIQQDEDFRKGLLLASPSLDKSINAYLKADDQHLNKRARARERSLVEYLLRAACKTSPFSTLTPVVAGDFAYPSPESTASIAYDLPSQQKRSHIRLNVAVLSSLSSHLLHCEALRKELLVQLTSGWRIENGRIRYLRKKHEMGDIDEENPITLSSIHEMLFYLPMGRIIESLVELIGDGRIVKLNDLIQQLSAKYAGDSAAEIAEYLQHLLRLGLLVVPGLQVDIHSHRPLTQYCQQLRAFNTPLTDTIARYLTCVDQLVDEYATASLARRRQILKEIHGEIEKCYAALGKPNASIQRTLLYEDTTLPAGQVTLDKEQWEQTLTALSEFQYLLPIFDINIQRKLVTKGYFRKRYGLGGQCDDFLAFADQFHLEFFEQYMRSQFNNRNLFDENRRFIATHNHFQQPEIELLDQGRQAVADYITAAYATRQTEADDLILDDDFLETIAPYVPLAGSDFQSQSYFAQFAQENGAPLLVLNRVYMGLTTMFSRFAHCFQEGERNAFLDGLRQSLLDIQPDNAVFAELKGGFDMTNLNLHPYITPYEIVCPGDITNRPEAEQIPISDLFIRDDPESDSLRLYSRRLNKEVIPVYLGFLMPMALPEIQQILLNFSYASVCPLYMWLGTTAPSAGNTIARYPRIQYKNILLHRALWKVDPDYFPQLFPEQTDADYFLSVYRWHKDNQLPRRCFLTPDSTPSQTQAADGDPDRGPGYHKPLYVDFENYFAVNVLESTVRHAKRRVVFNEMLPHRDDLWLKVGDQSYVTEFVLEFNRIRDEHND